MFVDVLADTAGLKAMLAPAQISFIWSLSCVLQEVSPYLAEELGLLLQQRSIKKDPWEVEPNQRKRKKQENQGTAVIYAVNPPDAISRSLPGGGAPVTAGILTERPDRSRDIMGMDTRRRGREEAFRDLFGKPNLQRSFCHVIPRGL